MKTKSFFSFFLCALVIFSTHSIFAQSRPASSLPADWKTYSNADFHLRFSYPPDWNVSVSTAKPEFVILLLSKGTAKSAGQEDLRIDAYKKSKPGDENIDQDAGGVKFNAQLTLGGQLWKVFNEPLHPDKKTIPLYYLRKVQGSILYVVSATNQTALNPVQSQIVSSFRFE
ncbi:MAG: hypothetical protein U1F57_05405 [bacterium]